MTREHLATSIAFGNMAGVKSGATLGGLLQHFFIQSGVDIGITDLLAAIRRREAK